MLRNRTHICHMLAALTLISSSAYAGDASQERLGVPVQLPDDDSPLNPHKLREAIKSTGGKANFKILKIHSVEPAEPRFDATNFVPDTRSITELCFSSVGPWVPYGDSFRDSDLNRAMTCESRDAIVKALGFTSVFLKGTSYVCQFTPLPQAQIAAKVFDISSYASSSIALVVSATKCENKLEEKFNALVKTCEDLRTMGIDCRGVDNTPF